MTRPIKPFTGIEDQIDILVSRGLLIERSVAQQWLQSVGYYRLSGYWYPYREQGTTARFDRFVPGSSFSDVIALYEFDRKLRTLIHDGIERIEIALRSHLSHHLGQHHPFAYQDPTYFRSTFDQQSWLRLASSRVDRAYRHSESIRHHRAKYGGSLPIWVLTEVLDFSDVSRLYDGLLATHQWAIAERLGVVIDLAILTANQRRKVLKSHPFARWLEQLTVVRNISAHHSRVWNRSLTPVSTAALRTINDLHSLPEGQSERLYGALIVMGFLLQRVSPGTSWMTKIRTLVDHSFPSTLGRTVAEMGFPAEWHQQHLWS